MNSLYVVFLFMLMGCGDVSLEKKTDNYSCSSIAIDTNITEIICQNQTTYAIGNICNTDVINNSSVFDYVCSTRFINQNCETAFAIYCAGKL